MENLKLQDKVPNQDINPKILASHFAISFNNMNELKKKWENGAKEIKGEKGEKYRWIQWVKIYNYDKSQEEVKENKDDKVWYSAINKATGKWVESTKLSNGYLGVFWVDGYGDKRGDRQGKWVEVELDTVRVHVPLQQEEGVEGKMFAPLNLG